MLTGFGLPLIRSDWCLRILPPNRNPDTNPNSHLVPNRYHGGQSLVDAAVGPVGSSQVEGPLMSGSSSIWVKGWLRLGLD